MALVQFINDSAPYLNAENLNNNFESCVNPSGAIMQYAGTTAPNGWLLCDGRAISRTTYKDLFDVIGTTYGSGDGSTTFNLPNLKGRVPVGIDNSDTDFDTLGNTGGEKKHTLTTAELPRQVYTSSGQSGSGEFVNTFFNDGTQYAIQTQGVNLNQPHNILQPYIVLNYIIKS